MPEMDGLEATRILRVKAGVNRDTPIIALTAHVLKEIREQCVEAGMTNFLTKPVSKEKLLETLRIIRWLQGNTTFVFESSYFAAYRRNVCGHSHSSQNIPAIQS